MDTDDSSHFSESNPPTSMFTTFRTTSESARDANTTAVFFLFLSTFATAICVTRAPLVAFSFLPEHSASLNLNASIGDTFPAMRPGFDTDSKTVITSKNAEAMNTSGDVLIVRDLPPMFVVPKTVGVSIDPSKYPRISPAGIPRMQRTTACVLITRLSCFCVAPMVFKSP